MDSDSSSRREDVARVEEIRVIRASSRQPSSHKREVEDRHVEQEEEDGSQGVIVVAIGDILPRIAPPWDKMLDEEASRPQGVEDVASQATAVRLPHVVIPHVYTRW